MSKSEYRLIDSGNFKKLEQVGKFRIIRPSAPAVWEPALSEQVWGKVDAIFTRGRSGDGQWKKLNRKLPEQWPLKIGDTTVSIKLTDFGHIGIFPEHHDWDRLGLQIKASKENRSTSNSSYRVLSLFAYTGVTSIAAASLGAEVVHIDASKTSVSWGRENAKASGMAELPIRWIIDDVQRFLAREIRRKSQYDAVILDPPSFGRGPKGDVWKIEEHLVSLLKDIKKILSSDYSFIQLSAHSQGMTPIALDNLLNGMLGSHVGTISSHEMVVYEQGDSKALSSPSDKVKGRALPSGACAIYERWPK